MNADARETLTVGGLFDGCGLLAYGLHLAGLEHRWLCEKDEFRQELLRQRFPDVPIYGDVLTIARGSVAAIYKCEERTWWGAVESVDVIAGGFPCKGISSNGKREGFAHPESALWREMYRVICHVRPRYVLVENVANLLSLHDGECFGEVLADLAASGYDCEWDCFPAAAFGAPHGRDRVFLTAVSYAERNRLERSRARGAEKGAARGVLEIPFVPDANECELPTGRYGGRADSDQARTWGAYGSAVARWEHLIGRPSPEPLVRRVDDGSTRRVERSRLSALGDGVLVQAGWLAGRRIMMHAYPDELRSSPGSSSATAGRAATPENTARPDEGFWGAADAACGTGEAGPA